MDSISRRAAIKAVEDLPNCYNGYSDTYDKACIIGLLEELPSAERKKGRWIPCEERLPEEDEDVLVSVHFWWLTQRHKTGWNDHIKESWYVDIASHIDGNWTSYSDEYKVARNRHEVIAWMPLPEPYKGEEV